MDCIDLLKSAQKTFGQSENEADYRNVIGQAYYSVFHLGQEIQAELNLPTYQTSSDLGSHEALIKTLHDCSNSSLSSSVKLKAKSLSFILKDLKNFRVRANYKLDETIDHAQAEYSIGQANGAFKAASELRELNKQ